LTISNPSLKAGIFTCNSCKNRSFLGNNWGFWEEGIKTYTMAPNLDHRKRMYNDLSQTCMKTVKIPSVQPVPCDAQVVNEQMNEGSKSVTNWQPTIIDHFVPILPALLTPHSRCVMDFPIMRAGLSAPSYSLIKSSSAGLISANGAGKLPYGSCRLFEGRS
jgi:hypothetical protein